MLICYLLKLPQSPKEKIDFFTKIGGRKLTQNFSSILLTYISTKYFLFFVTIALFPFTQYILVHLLWPEEE